MGKRLIAPEVAIPACALRSLPHQGPSPSLPEVLLWAAARLNHGLCFAFASRTAHAAVANSSFSRPRQSACVHVPRLVTAKVSSCKNWVGQRSQSHASNLGIRCLFVGPVRAHM